MNKILAIILCSLAFLACTNPASSSAEDLMVTAQMRSSCPDTAGYGLTKQQVSVIVDMSCEAWLWDYNGRFIAHHYDSGIYDTESLFNTTCSDAEMLTDLRANGQSGFFFLKIATTIDGQKFEQINCYYYNHLN